MEVITVGIDVSKDRLDVAVRPGARAFAADTSIGGARAVRELDALVARYGKPLCIVSGNGTELASRAVLAWTQEQGIGWHYITPGKPKTLSSIGDIKGRTSKPMKNGRAQSS